MPSAEEVLAHFTPDQPEEPAEPVEPPRLRPEEGDKVVSHWKSGGFYCSRLVRLDRSSGRFEVAWDDGDTTSVNPPLHLVARDVIPHASQLEVGARVAVQTSGYTYGSYQGRVTQVLKVVGTVLVSVRSTGRTDEVDPVDDNNNNEEIEPDPELLSLESLRVLLSADEILDNDKSASQTNRES